MQRAVAVEARMEAGGRMERTTGGRAVFSVDETERKLINGSRRRLDNSNLHS